MTGKFLLSLFEFAPKALTIPNTIIVIKFKQKTTAMAAMPYSIKDVIYPLLN